MDTINVYEVPESTGVYIQSAVADQFNRLIFASIWGHTAAIQATLARIVTGDLTEMTINGERLSVDKEMVKKVGKLPKDNNYGDMTHALIYRPTAVGEQAGSREVLFFDKPPENLIFKAVQSLSTVPLQDSWFTQLLELLRNHQMLIDLNTVCGNTHGIHINLGNEEALEYLISTQIKSGFLPIDEGDL
ncbi:MAG: hypothetical protein KGV56_05385 [Gammaproteobacteria bacterium]|nr:hypothetical protein [Gammaproteobacteria bacterium]